jgi:uncharacterized protein
MAQFDNNYAQAGTATRQTGAVVDQGLRSYMLRVYNYMAGGVAVSGLAAYATVMMATNGAVGAAGRQALTPFGQMIYTSPLKWVLMLAPLAFSMLIGFRIHKMSVGAAQTSFWAFATLIGVSLSSILLVFKMGSISSAFFATSASFAALSLWGYTTKRDLSGWHSFLIMGLFGAIIVGIVGAVMQWPQVNLLMSGLVLLVSAGLTAYHTQAIKDEYYAIFHDATAASKGAIIGALSLYINFINMFTSMLNIFGERD